MTNHTLNFTGHLYSETMLQVSLFGMDGKLPRNGGPNGAPYFPATTIRGAIRHAMHRHVVRLVNNSGERLDLENHYILSQGMDITGQALAESADGQVNFYNELRELNPALNLGGRFKLAGAMGVYNAFPEGGIADVAVVPASVRTDLFERDQSLISTLSEGDVDRYKTITMQGASVAAENAELKTKRAKLLREASRAEGTEKSDLFAEAAKIAEQMQENKSAKKEAKESIRRPNSELEVIAADRTLTHRMRLTQADLNSIGLFLASLREFARDPYLGGKRAYEFGRVSGKYEVTEWLPDADRPEVVGTVAWNDEGFTVTGELLESALAQWKKVSQDYKSSGLDMKKFVA